VLVGSASIAKNELVASALDEAGVPYEILNAKIMKEKLLLLKKLVKRDL